MAAVGELVRSTTGQWIARPPLRCPRGHQRRHQRVDHLQLGRPAPNRRSCEELAAAIIKAG